MLTGISFEVLVLSLRRYDLLKGILVERDTTKGGALDTCRETARHAKDLQWLTWLDELEYELYPGRLEARQLE